MRRRIDRSDERGVTLVAVVLLVLAVTALAHGLLVLSRFEYEVGRLGADAVAARHAAQAGASRLSSTGLAAEELARPVWALPDTVRGGVGGASYEAWRTRLGREVWSVEARATSVRAATERALRFTWHLDPVARVAASRGTVTVGGGAQIEGLAGVDGSRFTAHPIEEPDSSCADLLSALDSLELPRSLPTLAFDADSTVTRLGLLDLHELMARMPTLVSGAGTPEPLVWLGDCMEDPWNWGDPARPGGECWKRMALVASLASLRTMGGRGQGLLIVDGDLWMSDTSFNGTILLSGRLFADGHTSVAGLVRASGGIRLGPSARISASACWAAASLAGERIGGAVAVPGATWISTR